MKNERKLKYDWESFFKENVPNGVPFDINRAMISINSYSEKVEDVVWDLVNSRLHTSWYQEQKDRANDVSPFVNLWKKQKMSQSDIEKKLKSFDPMNEPGAFYRGKYISKKEIYERADQIAMAMVSRGVKKGDVIPVCMSNVPYLESIILACSKIGVVFSPFYSNYDADYINRIIEDSDCNFIFATDDMYSELKNKVKNFDNLDKIVVSLADDLPEKFPDEYSKLEIPEKYYKFNRLTSEYAKSDSKLMDIDSFKLLGKNYSVEAGLSYEDIDDKNASIFDVFSITRSSGTTDTPKAIVHNVLSYYMTLRFHDKDLSGLPENRDAVCLMALPCISDTAVKSVMSDNMARIIAFEPLINSNNLIYSLAMNRPDFVDASTSTWMQTYKKIKYDPKFKSMDLDYLGLPLGVGESTSRTERNFSDSVLALKKAGVGSIKKLLGLPIHTFQGTAGGRTESGGMFYKVLAKLYHTIDNVKNIGKTDCQRYRDFGNEACEFAYWKIVDDLGYEVKDGDVGELVETSLCDALGYYNYDTRSIDKLPEVVVKTDNGDISIPYYGVYARNVGENRVDILGRRGNEFLVNDSTEIPLYLLSRIALIDEKNVLSCEAVNVSTKEKGNVPVVHIDLNPDIEFNIRNKYGYNTEEYYKRMQEVMNKEAIRLQKLYDQLLPEDISKNLLFKFRKNDDNYSAFPLTPCTKRHVDALVQENIHDTIKPINILGQYSVVQGNDYVHGVDFGAPIRVTNKLFEKTLSNLSTKKLIRSAKVNVPMPNSL